MNIASLADAIARVVALEAENARLLGELDGLRARTNLCARHRAEWVMRGRCLSCALVSRNRQIDDLKAQVAALRDGEDQP